MIDRAGFGQTTHVDYPGEAIGSVSGLEDWNIVSRANMAFGQGLMVSSLQVASFYGAVANFGVQVQPHFLLARPSQTNPPSHNAARIMSEDSAGRLESMLRSVVQGHAPAADIEGFQVVGKTGTAEKAENGEYLYDKHIVSFVGYIANSSSELVCLTSFDDPLEQLTAPPTQPLFREIMTHVANRFMVTGIDAIAKAKAALAAQAQAGELDTPLAPPSGTGGTGSTGGTAGEAGEADIAASAEGAAAGQPGSSNTGSSEGSGSQAAADASGSDKPAGNADISRSSVPRAYSITDPFAQPILRGEREGWLLDTSG